MGDNRLTTKRKGGGGLLQNYEPNLTSHWLFSSGDSAMRFSTHRMFVDQIKEVEKLPTLSVKIRKI